VNNEQQTQATDDPSGDGWDWVPGGARLRAGDVYFSHKENQWRETEHVGHHAFRNLKYRRRTEDEASGQLEIA